MRAFLAAKCFLLSLSLSSKVTEMKPFDGGGSANGCYACKCYGTVLETAKFFNGNFLLFVQQTQRKLEEMIEAFITKDTKSHQLLLHRGWHILVGINNGRIVKTEHDRIKHLFTYK